MDNIGNFINDLYSRTGDDEFVPVVFYYPEMDYLMYIREDCSYRADRISRFITVLWHPHEEEKLVGIKLKGFRKMFNHAKETSALSEGEFTQLIRWLSLALYRSGEELIEEHERNKFQKISPQLREIAEGVSVPEPELQKAA
ncbi:MAG: hypothetical protein IID61_09780 [SAR324 cluster bacterium]|nr:hypothetical protein [SAR324 cluster bacterium]